MMLRYALQTVRDRKGGFLGAFLALMCAAALITACGTLLETGLRGTVETERYAAAPVVVSADQNVHRTTVKHKKGKTKVKHKAKPLAERAWLPQRDIERRLTGVAGVGTVLPELTFLAQPLTTGGDDSGGGRPSYGDGGRPSYGHAWRSAALTPFRLVEGSGPRRADDLVIDQHFAERAGLAPGDRLTVQSTRSPRDYRVTGVAAPEHGALAHQTSLFFSPAEAERLAAHPGKVTAFGVLPKPGTDVDGLRQAVARALDGTTAQVSAGEDRGPVEFLDAAGARVGLVSMGGAMGGTSLLVAVLVVVGTFTLSVQQRHRELALLRAVAATPKQIRGLLGREALLIGAVAGGTGALAGIPLGAWLHGRFVDAGAVPATLERAVSPFPPLVALAVTLLGALASARIAGRRIVRIRPAEALAEARVEPARLGRSRLIAGLVLLIGGAVLVAVLGVLHTEAASTPVTFLAVVVLACAIAALGPLVVRATAALLRGPLRLTGPGGRLAHANLRGNAARMAAAVTPLALLTGMTCTVLFVQPTLGDAARTQARDGVRANWVLAAQGPGVPAQTAQRLRGAEGVEAVTEVVRTTVRVGLDKYPAQGVTPTGLTRTWDPDVTAGSLKGFDANSVAVSELAADQLGLRPGSTLRLTLGDGTKAALTVRAVYTRGLGFGDLTMAHGRVARHVDNPLAATVLVRSDRTKEQLAALVEKFPGAGAGFRSGIDVLTPDAFDGLEAKRQQANAEVNHLAMGLVLAFTAIAVVNTLAMSVSERIREFAMLRLAGATRRQVLRMLRTEALSVLLIGTALGSGVALAVLTAFSVGMTGAAAPTVTPLVYVCVVAVAGLLALTATALPGRAALGPLPVSVATAKE
ncbi:FtsX-like permease family protein [Streptomyces flavofungini]|uniref:FtsX-like permease family protein n=1 Tax=Streptomyces flavofungini TaxID=68200 RepID=UPI0034DDE69C